MTTIKARNGVTLSANATENNAELAPVVRRTGDFASRKGGRIRRSDRRNARMAKMSFLLSALSA